MTTALAIFRFFFFAWVNYNIGVTIFCRLGVSLAILDYPIIKLSLAVVKKSSNLVIEQVGYTL